MISVLSRCFWASKILWWILTSSESTLCCKFHSLLESRFDRIYVWNDLNLLFNCQITYIEDKNLFLNCYKCLKYMFWASKILWWIVTSSESSPCFKYNSLQGSQFGRIDVSNDLNLLFNAKIFSLSVISVWSRCFWASQILRWIVTSSESTPCCKYNSLQGSRFDRIDVWNDLNLCFNAKYLFLEYNKCLK